MAPAVAYWCCDQLKRDKIIRLIRLGDDEDTLVVISNRGRVALYDGGLFKCRSSFTLQLTDVDRNYSKRQHSAWITDAVYMMDCSTVVVASRERTLHFFTTVVVPFSERIRLYGMKDIPTSLAYFSSAELEPTLSIGDDGGDSFVLTFLKSSQALFKKRQVQGLQKVFWKELYLQAGMVDLVILPGSHKRPVLEKEISGPFHKVISCSRSPTWSLAIRQLHNKVPPVVINLAQGITCFAYEDQTGTIYTGSRDAKLRLWSSVNNSKPWAVLSGHSCSIVALLLLDNAGGEAVLWSLCEKPEVRCWDRHTLCCLQIISLQFPLPPGTKLEFAKRPLYTDGSSLLVACCDYLARISPSETLQRDSQSAGREEKAKSNGSASATSGQSRIPLNFREELLQPSTHEENQIFVKFRQNLRTVLPKSEDSPLLQDPHLLQSAAYEWEYQFQVMEPPGELVPLNSFKLREFQRLEKIRQNVREMIPFCSLSLPTPSPIQLDPELPVSSRMRRHGMEFFTDLDQIRSVNWELLDDGILSGLNSARSSLASSLTSYYKHKHLTEKKANAAVKTAATLEVSTLSPQSSRKSSVTSQVSDNSSVHSGSTGK